MRIPRDITGDDLVKLLAPLGYRVTRQTGSRSHGNLTKQGWTPRPKLSAYQNAFDSLRG